jgi:hypothetical protein
LPLPLPFPSNIAYFNDWFAFLTLVANRYGNNSEFRMIAAGGATSVSDEATLPFDAKARNEWTSLNYTTTQYIDAWKQVFCEYSQLFPNQYVSLAAGKGLKVTPSNTILPDGALIFRAPIQPSSSARAKITSPSATVLTAFRASMPLLM